MVKLIGTGEVGVVLGIIIDRSCESVAHIIVGVIDGAIAALCTGEPVELIIGEGLVVPGGIRPLDAGEITVVVIGVDTLHLLTGIGYLNRA
ncbi:hypothetical protein ES703_89613 [subsurface metagenome]